MASDVLPIEHVWDLVGQHLAYYPCHTASIDELLVGIQTIYNVLHQADIQNLFDSMPGHIAARITASDGYGNTDFRYLIVFFFENANICLYQCQLFVY